MSAGKGIGGRNGLLNPVPRSTRTQRPNRRQSVGGNASERRIVNFGKFLRSRRADNLEKLVYRQNLVVIVTMKPILMM